MGENTTLIDDACFNSELRVPKGSKWKKNFHPPISDLVQPIVASITHNIAEQIEQNELDRIKKEKVEERKIWKTMNLRSKSRPRSK